MCYNYMKVRSKSPQGVKYSFIPCGHCAECRNASRMQWSTRLALELSEVSKRGWKVAFFTLTYDNDHLPYIPAAYFPHGCSELVPCFYRPHVRNFVDAIRKWLHRNYGIVGCPYLVASDFGDHTHRPHYHGLIAYPVGVRKKSSRFVDKSAPSVFDSFALHAKFKELWTHGFIFPRHPLGGTDSHGYEHKAFELTGDVVNASFYAAKYCAKSISFYDLTMQSGVDRSIDGWRDYDCFHIQSKSLGLSYLKSLSFDEQFKLLRTGISFVGKPDVYNVPVYFKNKLLFNPTYYYRPDGSRAVGRDVTPFFEKYYPEIYKEKVKFYSQIASDCVSVSFLRARGVACDESNIKILQDYKSSSRCDDASLAEAYLGYFGVSPTSIYKGLRPVDQWFARYYPKRFDCLNVDYDFSARPEVKAALDFWSYLFGLIRDSNGVDEAAEWEISKVRDFHISTDEET